MLARGATVGNPIPSANYRGLVQLEAGQLRPSPTSPIRGDLRGITCSYTLCTTTDSLNPPVQARAYVVSIFQHASLQLSIAVGKAAMQRACTTPPPCVAFDRLPESVLRRPLRDQNPTPLRKAAS